MTDRDFTKIFLSNIKAGDKVLDFGTGSGEFSQMFADKGAVVTAVDPKVPEYLGESINSKRMKVEDFVAREQGGQYDLIFMRNILQFLDKQWVFEILFPWLHKHLKRGGVIGIETFYQEPEPAFEHPLRSLYSTQELIGQLLSWQELYCEQYKYHGSDLGGTMRDFFISDVIVRKI